jgi:hypothetical protein
MHMRTATFQVHLKGSRPNSSCCSMFRVLLSTSGVPLMTRTPGFESMAACRRASSPTIRVTIRGCGDRRLVACDKQLGGGWRRQIARAAARGSRSRTSDVRRRRGAGVRVSLASQGSCQCVAAGQVTHSHSPAVSPTSRLDPAC